MLHLFGTKEHPIRCSSIPRIVRCNWREVALFIKTIDNADRASADTGSAYHKAVSAWHDSRDVRDAIQVMSEGKADYPLADLEEASELFLHYAGDDVNLTAKIFAKEQSHEWAIDCSERDETGQPIVIQGTFDQIREIEGGLFVFDLKTGKPSGSDMLADHMLQVSAYAMGATNKYQRPVHPGGIIRARGYTSREKRVFYPYRHRIEHCHTLMDSLREIVAMIRSGNVFPNPGGYCHYCEFLGVDKCVPELIQLGE